MFGTGFITCCLEANLKIIRPCWKKWANRANKCWQYEYQDNDVSIAWLDRFSQKRAGINVTKLRRNNPIAWRSSYRGFGREKDGNRGKFNGSNLVIFCYKESEKFALCKSISQSEVIFIVYSEPIESGHVKINFS